ncbi:PASTA domain-containing protein, partial [Myxococcota bacterium]|nr:PASTA domain-containing protein [Myxococcota bacterium]
PVFSEIGEASMRYLGLVPSAEILEQPVIAEPVIIEEEPALDAVQAKAGQAPSFIGLSARQATERYVKAALATRLEMSGSGRVIRQEPSAGAPLNNETAIRLVLGRK